MLSIKGFFLSNEESFLFGGVDVLGSRELALLCCDKYLGVTNKLEIPYVFKTSFDKANRSSMDSFREAWMKVWRFLVRSKLNLMCLITDIHKIHQIRPVAEVVGTLQVPTFLARQADFVVEIAKAGKPINIKKPRFMSPTQVKHVVKKCRQAGNNEVMVRERASCFGYDNLVVDMLGFRQMKEVTNNAPIIFDVTHSLQHRDALGDASGGRRAQVLELA